MTYHVIAFTMAQVRQGALGFQRELSAVLREKPEIKVYSVSPFDLDERRRAKERFGGDVVYFFNDAAYKECERLELDFAIPRGSFRRRIAAEANIGSRHARVADRRKEIASIRLVVRCPITAAENISPSAARLRACPKRSTLREFSRL